MNIYQKLQAARVQLQNRDLKKSGNNKFAGYRYFELADFLPTVNAIFEDIGLCGVVSFTADQASLSIYNSDKPEEIIVFTSPMSSAALKGCHEVQNLGAVETYIRRYLYTAAMELTESDALDATQGKSDPLPQNREQQFQLDEKIVGYFNACRTMEDLKACWNAVPVGMRSQYAALKDEAKHRIGGDHA